YKRGKQRAQYQVFLNRFERSLDKSGLVFDDLDAEVGWQQFLQILQSLLDGINNLNRIGSRLLADLHHYRLFGVQPGDCARFFDSVLDVTDVANAHRRGTDVGDNDVVELFYASDSAQSSKGHFAGALVDSTARHLDVLRGESLPNLIDGQVVSAQLLRVEIDFD